MEYIGDTPNILRLNYHYGKDWQDHKSSYKEHDAGFDLSKDFHIFALLWEEEHVKWYIDGQEVGR